MFLARCLRVVSEFKRFCRECGENLHFLHDPDPAAKEDNPRGLSIFRVRAITLEEVICGFSGGAVRIASLEAIPLSNSLDRSQLAETCEYIHNTPD